MAETQESMVRSLTISGFERISLRTEGRGSGEAQGVYLGAPVSVTELRARISGGSVALHPSAPDSLSAETEPLYEGTGSAPNGQSCTIFVFRMRAGQQPFNTWGLSDQQAKDAKMNRKLVVLITAVCGGG